MNRRSVILAGLTVPRLTAAEFPRPAGKLVFPGAEGKVIDLEKYRGKTVVIEFLSTVCRACQDCAQFLSKLQGEYQSKGVQFLGAAVNPGAAPADFTRTYGVTFPVGTIAEDEARKFLQVSVMQPFMVPHLAFIDKGQVIQAQRGGSEQGFSLSKDRIVREELNKILSATKPKAKA